MEEHVYEEIKQRFRVQAIQSHEVVSLPVILVYATKSDLLVFGDSLNHVLVNYLDVTDSHVVGDYEQRKDVHSQIRRNP